VWLKFVYEKSDLIRVHINVYLVLMLRSMRTLFGVGISVLFHIDSVF
jgi:hypothetical protein